MIGAPHPPHTSPPPRRGRGGKARCWGWAPPPLSLLGTSGSEMVISGSGPETFITGGPLIIIIGESCPSFPLSSAWDISSWGISALVSRPPIGDGDSIWIRGGGTSWITLSERERVVEGEGG